VKIVHEVAISRWPLRGEMCIRTTRQGANLKKNKIKIKIKIKKNKRRWGVFVYSLVEFDLQTPLPPEEPDFLLLRCVK
jgi:hypothetical protein